MVELIIIACLLKQPEHCEAFHLPFAPETSLAQCLGRSAINAATWVADHPSWKIRRLRCGQPET
jgi:hypothetical protein